MRRILSLLASLYLSLAAQPATAAVTITFWSHDQDNDFPHAFFALKGTPDAGGAPLDENHGFTAKAITPALLWGPVAGEVEAAKRGYMNRSTAQFSVVLSDAQLRDVQALVTDWNVRTKYDLNSRNCIHFVAEALRRSGVTVPSLPQYMKKPKSFLVAVGQANDGRVTQIRLRGADYFARYEPDATAAATPFSHAVNLARIERRP